MINKLLDEYTVRKEKHRKELATELMKVFTFEELALLFYDNMCCYCNNCEHTSSCGSMSKCAKHIRETYDKYCEKMEIYENIPSIVAQLM